LRIRDYRKATGLTLEEIKGYFGSPSPHRHSNTIITGESHKGTIVQGTLIIEEDNQELSIYALRAVDSGGGSMMMRKICHFADQHRLGITHLTPSPYSVSDHAVGVRKLWKNELIAFYERFGFVMGKDKTMSRLPR
jgi:hypothetical protein